MKRLVLISVIMTVALMLPLSFPTFAQESTSLKKNYVSVTLGIFVPTSDLDEYDTLMDFNFMYGRYFSKNVALEASVGVYLTEATSNGVSPTVGSYQERDMIAVVPYKVNLKRIFPFPQGEFYIGAGIGLYYATSEIYVYSPGQGSFSIEDSAAVIGGQVKAGVIIYPNDILFAGFEGEYMVTDTAEFSGSANGFTLPTKTDLNGFVINLVCGIRF